MEPIIGIDLGTFNSCVSTIENGRPTVIADRGGYKVTPSIVAVTESGRRMVGHIAKRQAVTNAENTIYAAKRLIGRTFESTEVQRAIETYPYRIVCGEGNEPQVQLKERTHKVPEISAMVLQELRNIAEKHMEVPISKAVITVPAYFNDGQRQATRDAGRIAGLDVIRIINEPTAAALAYGFGKRLDRTVAIYDLGGGTFDVSVLEISSSGVFRVLATAGDTFLGGEDFDRVLLDSLAEEFMADHDVDLRKDRMALQRLRDAAEKAKCELSAVHTTEINLPFVISAENGEALHLQVEVSRDRLETLSKKLIDRTIEICAQTLDAAKLTWAEIEDIILVGGMTRMPAVQSAVKSFFDREPCKGVHPDEVVALGAAIQGDALLDEESDMILLDVTPHKLGIMTAGRGFEELIARNTTIPTAHSKVFTTNHDQQTAVRILVMQGVEDTADGNDLLGEFVLTGLRPAPRGEVEVEVTFEIDADGIVSVLARNLETGQKQSITVTATSDLSREEIEGLIVEAQDFAVTHKESEEAKTLRYEIETKLDEARRLRDKVEGLVAKSGFGGDSLREAQRVLDEAEAQKSSGDMEVLKSLHGAVSRALKMYELLSGM